MDRKEDNSLIIDFLGEQLEFQLLNVFEFNSDRKRMSVVLKDSNGKHKIITKGADNVIIKRLRNYNLNVFSEKKESDIIKNIPNHLQFFGEKGLRTLLFAQRDISELEYATFTDAYNVSYLIN